jgi:hypothetical protein
MHDSMQPVQHIHGTKGAMTDRGMHCADRDRELLRVPTIADIVPLTEIMSRNMTCAHRDLEAEHG